MMMKTLDSLSIEGLGIGLIDEDEAADDGPEVGCRRPTFRESEIPSIPWAAAPIQQLINPTNQTVAAVSQTSPRLQISYGDDLSSDCTHDPCPHCLAYRIDPGPDCNSNSGSSAASTLGRASLESFRACLGTPDYSPDPGSGYGKQLGL
ncbi:hypothetical protein BKA56DRAFT_616615 [Ilyonectria sp. MPI-CAGE-AT-0026]|nr:hypothetical protein BKA56DRAFT_616615 [Ilyonectria sp. MPI-CAGE-AT-0026]